MREQRPELERIFRERSAAIYRGMIARAAEKRSKSGRILRVGREMPFSLPEFRAWLLERLGGNAAGLVGCAYCTAWLNVQTLCVDHAIPLAAPWSGSMDLENLACACAACRLF